MRLPIARLAVGLACLTAAQPAVAQQLVPAGSRVEGVQLSDGERVVLTVQEGGVPRVVSHGPSPADPALRAPQVDTRVETVAGVAAQTNTAGPAQLVASFHRFGAKGGSLVVENGYDHPVIYDAAILKRQGDRVVAVRTSICPVAAHGVGTESWGDDLEGVALLTVRQPAAGDMRCSGEAALTAPSPGARSNTCLGARQDWPVGVYLSVDPATGARRGAQAIWQLHDATGGPATPAVTLEYPMQGSQLSGRPVSLNVLAVAAMSPPPTSKAASIVVLADGVEAIRKPWGMYAQRRAALASMPRGATPVGFVGVIPFPRTDDSSADPAFAAMLAGVGDGKVKRLEVRIVGDDGAVIGRGAYALDAGAVRDTARIDNLVAIAEQEAAAPDHCAQRKRPN